MSFLYIGFVKNKHKKRVGINSFTPTLLVIQYFRDLHKIYITPYQIHF